MNFTERQLRQRSLTESKIKTIFQQLKTDSGWRYAPSGLRSEFAYILSINIFITVWEEHIGQGTMYPLLIEEA